MRLGKLDNDKLESLVLNKIHHRRREVKCAPNVGIDCAAVDLGGRLAVMSTDPITSADKNVAALTVHVSCNDAAAAGAEPIGLLVTLLIPPSATFEQIDELTDELSQAADEAGVDIIGGHTEVTDSVTRIVTSATVIARAINDKPLAPSEMKKGDSIIMTKWAGLEGTAIIASDMREKLKSALTDEELDEASGFISSISVVKEGLYAARNGATAMHDITEGGVYGALWELAYSSGTGITIDRDAIRIHPLTRRICAELNIDPYRLISSGCMLIAAPNGEEMVEGLKNIGIESAIIARAEGEGVMLADGTPVEKPGADELYKVLR